MHPSLKYRYRAAFHPQPQHEPTAATELLEHLTVQATDAVTTQRAIAAGVRLPERPGEVPPQYVRYLTRRQCPQCKTWACTAVCTHCGAFKFPKIVEPFADELAATERRAA